VIGLVSGEVQLLFSSIPARCADQFRQNEGDRCFGSKRSSALPDVPTSRKRGCLATMRVVWPAASTGVPRSTMDTLSREVVTIMRAGHQGENAEPGFEPVGNGPQNLPTSYARSCRAGRRS